VNVRVFLRNASQLPIEIVHVGAEIRSRWAVLDILQRDKRVGASKPVDGTERSTFTFGGIRLVPDQNYEHRYRLDMSHHAPARSSTLALERGIVGEFRSILVIDNAGRRWRLRPGRGGSAKRVRRGRKRKDEYEPHHC
jgi:hypothetical protein